MLEKIFALLMACITIFIAQLLVHKQNKISETVKHLNNEIENNIEELINDIEALTGEKPIERTLIYLERRMEMFDKTINSIKTPISKRRNKNVEYKKDFTDD